MKKMGKIISLLFCFFIVNVKANSISSINMDIYIDQTGKAYINEVWNANLNEGTEGYRTYGNLGNATISNFKVYEGGVEYTDIGSWDINSSFDKKAYKSGIHHTKDALELCFGISRYGYHVYNLSYEIDGFVSQLEDAQMIYWELIPSSLANLTDKVYIKIHSDFKYEDDLNVWGYGNYGGYAYVYDGVIEVSNDDLNHNDYMTILVKFNQGTFTTNNKINGSFQQYYDMAEEGAEHYIKKTSFREILSIIMVILFYIIIFLFIVFSIIITSRNSNLKSGSIILDFGEKGRKLPKDVNMFRDIPCNKDIYYAYFVAHNYKLMKKQTDFLGVILLKWLKEKKIKIQNKSTGMIFKKEEANIIFEKIENITLENELEKNLYSYMYEASKDGILESKEFERWCQNHYSKFLSWFDEVLDYENKKLEAEGKLKKMKKTTMKIFSSTVYQVDPSIYEDAVQMKGLKTFFQEFDNMSDKQAIEVMLFEEYLMYAQMFGVAEKVAKQFKKLYPDIITDYNYNSVIFIHDISYIGVTSANSAKSRAQAYSSGGGGFSSGGGGRGSFGSGGGGGFR